MNSILGFLLCAVVIFYGGTRLSYYGDQIAEKTGLGKAWIGLILMASVTSLPELMVGVSSSAIVGSADLAVGDILGSCAFNLAILAMLDLFLPRRQHLFFVASGPRHILSASMGMILIALAGVGLFLQDEIKVWPGIGIISFAFLVIYLLSIRLIYRFDVNLRATEVPVANGQKDQLSLKKTFLYYTLFALIVIVAALFIPHFAEEIAISTGLGTSFVGTVLVAASTSLPEIAVSLAAVRMGSIDLAVGNLFGSNIFNILILFIDDLFYTKGILLRDASDMHLVSVFFVMMMTAVAIAGFTYRSPKKRFLMAFDAVLILAFYVLNMVVLFFLTRNP